MLNTLQKEKEDAAEANVKKKDMGFKCFGNMFREDGRLTYGAMICDECENVEKCWEYSKSRGK